jgi:hypothetical protein
MGSQEEMRPVRESQYRQKLSQDRQPARLLLIARHQPHEAIAIDAVCVHDVQALQRFDDMAGGQLQSTWRAWRSNTV